MRPSFFSDRIGQIRLTRERAGISPPVRTLRGCRLFGGRHDVDDLATAASAELHRAGLEREQGVVAATADVLAGVEVGAALADEDLAGLDDLAAEALDAEALRVGVTTVAGRARALLVCHCCAPLSRSR